MPIREVELRISLLHHLESKAMSLALECQISLSVFLVVGVVSTTNVSLDYCGTVPIPVHESHVLRSIFELKGQDIHN